MNYLNSWHFWFLIWYYTKVVKTSSPYKTILLDDYNVCNIITTRTVKFDTTSAINLTQSRLSDHSLEWSSSFNCHFRLKAGNKHSGIVVVIQELVFRKDETTDECIDYVQFKTEKGRTSEKICGKITAKNVMDSLYEKPSSFDTQVKLNTFISDHGHLDVYIFISKEELLPHEITSINIVFTLFKHCVISPDNYKTCVNNREICIHETYFSDGVINCPFIDCVDESGCDHNAMISHTSIGNKVLIGSVTSLVLIFVIFILCLYICRKHGKLCWAEQFATPNNTMETQATRVIELNESPNQSQNISATASSLVDQDDKDLPPSYESLFPSR